MWPPPWLSSPSRVASTPSSTHRRTFSTHTSFKDIETLLNPDSNPTTPHHQNRSKAQSIFHRVRLSTSLIRALSSPNPKSKPEPDRPITLTQSPITDRHVIVIYFTSLRVVRRTFDDCRTVRSILRSFRAPLDERDVSMDATFLHELHQIFNTTKNDTTLTLPRVFISGRYVGGAEEVRRLHESGQLKQLVGRFPVIGSGLVCHVCDGHRFVVCENYDGSHKVYFEKVGFRSCGECYLNGLIRCPNCFPR